MAYATQVTIGAGRKVSVNYNSQDVNVAVSYQLERDDTDLLKLVREKSAEVEAAHQVAWRRLHDRRTAVPEEHENADRNTNRNKAEAAQSDDMRHSCPAVTTDKGSEISAHQRDEGDTPQQMDEPAPDPPEESREESATQPQKRAIQSLAERLRFSNEELEKLIGIRFGRPHMEELTKRQARVLLEELQRKARSQPTTNKPLPDNQHQAHCQSANGFYQPSSEH